MTTDERIDRLTRIVDSLAGAVVHHDDQIEKILVALDLVNETDRKLQARIEAIAELSNNNSKLMAALTDQVSETSKAVANLEKQWQAYINTLPHQ